MQSSERAEVVLQITSVMACAARRAPTGGPEWKEQLSELFPEETSRQPLSRKRPRIQENQGSDPSDDSAPRHEAVEEVFGLESGWSVEVLGNDDGEDDLMLIGSEVQARHTDPLSYTPSLTKLLRQTCILHSSSPALPALRVPKDSKHWI